MTRLRFKKRGLLLICFLLLLSTPALAALNLTLHRTKVSPLQPFDGTLTLTFTTPLPKNTPITFVITDKRANTTLAETVRNLDYTLEPPTYAKSGSPTSTPTLTFASAGSHVTLALDLSQNGVNTYEDIIDIISFNVTLEGTQQDNHYPTSPRLDIGNDGTIEYSYKGAPLATYNNLDTSYLGSPPPPQPDTVIITGNPLDIFCQEITLEPATTYRVSAKIKRNNPGDKNLTATLTATLPGSSDGLCTPEAPCCSMTTTSTSLNDQSCTISKDIQHREPAYLCVFIPGGEEPREYYELGQKTGNQNPKGARGGTPSRRDYFLWAAWQDYERTLISNIRPPISTIAVDALKTYKDTCSTPPCLLIPLNISSASLGKIILKDLQLKFDANGLQVINTFTPITLYPERIRYENTILVDLSSLANILTPRDLGTNREVYVLFNGERSNTLRFDIVPGPTAIIKKNKAIIKIGETITFDGSQSKPVTTSLQTYEWNFGDGAKASGKTASHSYRTRGFYTATLKVVDGANLAGISTSLVEVTGEENFTARLARTEHQIIALNAKLQDHNLQKSAHLLGIPTRLEQAHANLTLIQQRAKNATPENQTLLEQELALLTMNLPLDFIIVQAITYDPRLARIEDVPTVLNTDTIDDYAAKVYSVQSKVSVKSEVQLVKIKYGTHDDTMILVTKDVSGQAGRVYETIPASLTITHHLTEVAEAVSPTLVRSTTPTIAYTLEGATLEDLINALQTRTFVVPGDLSSITIEEPPSSITITEGFACGNNQCELGEDANVCPEDCAPKRPLLPLAIIGAVAFILLVYIFLYNGKYNFQELFGGKKSSGARNLYPTERDYLSVKHYVETSLNRGFTQDQIALALKKKGWTLQQITPVFKEAKPAKTIQKK